MKQIADKHVYAVVMAGGIGSKLWPLSRKKSPKQFLHFFDGGTMIRKTVERIAGAVRRENILIITGKQHRRLVNDSLPDFDVDTDDGAVRAGYVSITPLRPLMNSSPLTLNLPDLHA